MTLTLTDAEAKFLIQVCHREIAGLWDELEDQLDMQEFGLRSPKRTAKIEQLQDAITMLKAFVSKLIREADDHD